MLQFKTLYMDNIKKKQMKTSDLDFIEIKTKNKVLH